MEYRLPLEMFQQWERTVPDKVFLRQPIAGEWRDWTWREVGDEARRMAAYLHTLELPPGSQIGLISKNCAHWIIADLAIMLAGHVSVPLYPNLTASSVEKILTHSETRVVFIGKLDDWASMAPGMPDGVLGISFPFYPHAGYAQWYDIIEAQTPLTGEIVREAGDLMTIIYTSGTTGMPKGVMHSFATVAFAISEGVKFIGLTDRERFFSYLPLAHVGERLVVEMGSLYAGGTVCFAESLETFPANLREARPTVFLGVHRIWKKFQDGILSRVSERKLRVLLHIPILAGMVRRKIRKGLGFADARVILTAATPTPPELIRWYKRLGIILLEGYSMTENFGYSHANPADRIRIGTVGKPLPHSEVRLGAHQEVQVRNAAAMLGYYKEPELTREMFTADGFMCTGDEGQIDAEGYLTITGRTKDIFKTSKGKYVVPAPIEMMLTSLSELEWACVTGTGLPQPIALLTLSESGRQLPTDELQALLTAKLEAVNAELDAHERLAKVVVLADAWTPDNNMLTPTFKLKRNEIDRRYRERMEGWYEQAGEVVRG